MYSRVLDTDVCEITFTYDGSVPLDRDAFLMHFTGYDDAIGNKIVGQYDFPNFPECNEVKEYQEIMDKEKTAISTSFSYFNPVDVINFYEKCLKQVAYHKSTESKLSFLRCWEPQYNERINKFGFKIVFKYK